MKAPAGCINCRAKVQMYKGGLVAGHGKRTKGLWEPYRWGGEVLEGAGVAAAVSRKAGWGWEQGSCVKSNHPMEGLNKR